MQKIWNKLCTCIALMVVTSNAENIQPVIDGLNNGLSEVLRSININITSLDQLTNFTKAGEALDVNKMNFGKALGLNEILSLQNITDNVLPPLPFANLTNLSNLTNLANLQNLTNLTNLEKLTNVTNLENLANLTNLEQFTNLTNLEKLANLTNLEKLTNLTNLSIFGNLTEFLNVGNLTENLPVPSSTVQEQLCGKNSTASLFGGMAACNTFFSPTNGTDNANATDPTINPMVENGLIPFISCSNYVTVRTRRVGEVYHHSVQANDGVIYFNTVEESTNTPATGDVIISASLTRLMPMQEYKMRILKFGDITAIDESSSIDDIYNPDGIVYDTTDPDAVIDGAIEDTAGYIDLTITSDAAGNATFEITNEKIRLCGPTTIVGRTLVLYQNNADTNNENVIVRYGNIGLGRNY